MTALTESTTWDTGVYQLELADPVQGGPGGIDNLPHQNLANRTLWLKSQITALGTAVASLAPINSASLTGIPTAPTPTAGANSSQIVNAAYVDPRIGSAGALSFRNKIINGNFDFWRRGLFQLSAGYGSADRWLWSTAGSTVIVTRGAFTLGQTNVPGQPSYFCSTVVSSVANAANFARQSHRIEGVRTFAGRSAVISFWASADAPKNIAVELVQNFGAGGSPSASVTSIGTFTAALTTGWTKYSFAVAVPSISGATLGTAGDHLELIFWFDAGSNFSARTNALGQQSGTFRISSVQAEEGVVATSFEVRPPQVELALCRRFYRSTFPDGTQHLQNAGVAGATSIAQIVGPSMSQVCNSINFDGEMRAAPAITLFNPSAANADARNVTAAADCSSTSVSSIQANGFVVSTTTAAATAAGQQLLIHWSADAEL